MRKTTTALAGMLLGALLGLQGPAQAPEVPEVQATAQEPAQTPAPVQEEAEEWEDFRTPKPEVVYALSSRRVQVEVVGDGWGVRLAAREFDRAVPGLRIFTRGSCDDRPRAVCVRVVEGSYGEEEEHYLAGAKVSWSGLATFPEPGLSVVYLNEKRRTDKRYAVAAHEFAHVLGLAHHDSRGVVGATPDVVHLSPLEIRALRGAYGEQR